ncbi:MAG: hypothetical protein A2W35_08000, partial [Chloroflexi bacterium RBG_16_57_11]
MSINRSLWLQSYKEEAIPDWICPACSLGILRPVKNSFHTAWDSYSEQTNNTPNFEHEVVQFRYIVMLQCNNEKCREGVVSAGEGKFVPKLHYDNKGQQELLFIDTFTPQYFVPPLCIFQIPAECPEAVARHIRSSFKLFFSDPPASANYIRKTVGAILTSKGINQYSYPKGKQITIKLHDRIVEFEKSKPETAKKLFAIK